jgi:ribosomal protein S18 acetylase RimI-like enzyme
MVCDLVEVPRMRAATAADARGIAAIHVRAWQAAYRGLVPVAPLAALSTDAREELWRRVIAQTETNTLQRLWVVEQSGAITGFAATGVTRDDDAPPATGEVYAIYIEPALIGTGLGRRLFAHAVDALASQDFEGATLWALESNARSRRFYEAAGWRADGRQKTERWEGIDLVQVRYARRLKSG